MVVAVVFGSRPGEVVMSIVMNEVERVVGAQEVRVERRRVRVGMRVVERMMILI